MISQRTLGLRKISLQCVESARMSLRMDRDGSCTMLADAMPKIAVAILRTRQGVYTHALFRLPSASRASSRVTLNKVVPGYYFVLSLSLSLQLPQKFTYCSFIKMSQSLAHWPSTASSGQVSENSINILRFSLRPLFSAVTGFKVNQMSRANFMLHSCHMWTSNERHRVC